MSQTHSISLSRLMKEATLEKIEDEAALASYKEAMKAYRNDPRIYSPEEVDEMLGSVKLTILTYYSREYMK